jgi:hypothetical protein
MDPADAGNTAIQTGLVGLLVTFFQIFLNAFVVIFQQTLTSIYTGAFGSLSSLLPTGT